MSQDFRKTATCQTLVRCLIRYIQRQRAEALDMTNTSSPIDTDEGRATSNRLDQVDHALTELGQFDTRAPNWGVDHAN